MAAPDLTQREVCFVQKIGTDDAGANAVGAPQPRLTIAAALADLAANYPPATSTFFHIVAVGPGTFTEAGISLPPWTFIEGTCDGESQPTSIILLTGDINLSSAWTANAAVRGGLSNLSIRAASGTPALDFTMPVPVAGNPLRTVELHNVHHNLVSEIFEATSTADTLVKEFCRQFGVNTDTFRQTGGTSRFNNVWSAALVTIIDKASFATVGQWDGLIVSATGSSLTASSIAAAGTTLRLTNSAVRTLVLAQPAPGVLAVSADAPSIPIRSAVSYTGLASATNLTLLSDAAGEAYTPTTPANWSPVPTTVQGALDTLGASAGGGGGGTGNFAQIIRTGNRSSAAWGTAGCAISDTANTFTDSTSAGAVAGVTAARTFGIPTFASAGGVTYAITANVYIDGPPVVTGGTATAIYSFYVNSGSSLFGGTIFGNNVTAIAANDFTMTVSTGSVTVNSARPAVTGATYLINNTSTNGPMLEFRKSSARMGSVGVDGNYLNTTAANFGIFAQTNLVFYTNFSGTETARFNTSGNLLIGITTNGTGLIQIGNTTTTAGAISWNNDFFVYRTAANKLGLTAGSGTDVFLEFYNNTTRAGYLQSNGTTQILMNGNTSLVLQVGGGSVITLSNSGATGVRFNGYGAGAITADASGNLTAVSDARMKDVRGTFDRGLKEICGLVPKRFQWNKLSGLSRVEMNAGFIAQDVLDFIPEAVNKGADGIYTFADRPITAALVNAVKEIVSRLEAIEENAN